MKVLKSLACGIVALSSLSAQTLAFEGESFEHKDWYLACDNTGTCRAAGYAPDGSEYALAVFFSRDAGPATEVNGRVFMQLSDDEPWPLEPSLFIDGQELGRVDIEEPLAQMQVQALLSEVTGNAVIELRDGKRRWALSGSGASAVFRKMDDYQGRANTPFAIVVKGSKPESSVRSPAPRPQVVNKAPLGELLLLQADSLAYQTTLALVQQALGDEFDNYQQDLSLLQADLGTGKALVFACTDWGYNRICENFLQTSAQFQRLPFAGDYYRDGVIYQSQKQRSRGDCVSSKSWAFDGNAMVPSYISTSGPCRGLNGGVGNMPTYVVDVMSASQQ